MFNPLTPETAYLLGFLATDGCVTKNTIAIEIQNEDHAHILTLANLFTQAGYNPHVRINTKNGRLYTALTVHNKNLAQELINLGLVRRKTFILKFFDWIPDNLLSHYIRGIIDGDGSIFTRRNDLEVSLCSASLDFITGFNQSLSKFGISPKTINIKSKNRLNPLYRLTLYSSQARLFIPLIYTKNDIALKRKYDTFHNFQRLPNKRITWTSTMHTFLWKNRMIMSLDELSKVLGKSKKAICSKLWRLSTEYGV